jgi:hypothetical protein
MSLQTIGSFRLLNEGGFIAKMSFNYIDDDGRNKATLQTGDIFPGQTMAARLTDFGVPDGALVYLQVDVVWDGQNKADEAFAHDRKRRHRLLCDRRHDGLEHAEPDRAWNAVRPACRILEVSNDVEISTST